MKTQHAFYLVEITPENSITPSKLVDGRTCIPALHNIFGETVEDGEKIGSLGRI